jgi:L-alanine-DL-glutamate epimerase-like enolase superfamily enzyme
MMNRRTFVLSLAASPLLATSKTATKIKRIRLSTMQGHFHKFVAMNAYDKAPKGRTYEHTLIRIETDAGVEGIGAGTYAISDGKYAESLKPLIGQNPFDLYRMDESRIVGRAPALADLLSKNRHLDGPLYDIVGKLTDRPVWRLIGNSVRERIPIYDSTIYFSDVWFKDRGVQAVTDECREAIQSGFNAIKIKLGRGDKWMERDAGDERDIEIVNRVREAVGPNVRVMADPNYGYRGHFDAAWRLLSQTKQANLYWMEEIFPETVDDYRRLREKMADAGMKTLLAAGEHVRDVHVFEPYLKPRRLMDVLQMDIRQGGFLDNVELAKLAAASGGVAIQHNWASQIGSIMAMHLSKAIEAIPIVESDRSTSDVIRTDGFHFENGVMTMPAKAGLGIEIDEKAYELQCKASEIIVS